MLTLVQGVEQSTEAMSHLQVRFFADTKLDVVRVTAAHCIRLNGMANISRFER